jgi:glycosyltransferase involved in cell wall biosynthesis
MADQFTAAHADFFSSDDLKQLLVQQLATKIIITPNGITLSDGNPFVSKNDNLVFVYGSAPNRGLDLVLRSWAAIRARLPGAVLEVYYGFTAAVSRHMEGALGKQGYGEWLDSMQALLRQDGVQYFGAVDHAQLTEAYERAGFLLYPTTFQETGCITALRAMVGGAIPVTSRLRESVLFELTRGFDMGPDRALDLRTASDEAQLSQWLREEWVEAVVRASQTEASVLTAHRERMASAIRDRSTWRSTAEELHLVFLKQLAM